MSSPANGAAESDRGILEDNEDLKNMTSPDSELARQNGAALNERGQRRSALGKKSDRAMTELSGKTEQYSQLQAGEAFQLYARRINHNLAMLLEQLVLLRAIVKGERESPTETHDVGDNRRPGRSEGHLRK